MLMVLSIMFHWYIAPSAREGSNRLNIIFFESFYMTLTLMSPFWHEILSTRIISTGTLPSRRHYFGLLDTFAIYWTRRVCWWLFLSLYRGSHPHDEVDRINKIWQKTITLLRLSQNIAGVTLLALGNGAPDIFSALAGIGQVNASLIWTIGNVYLSQIALPVKI